MADFHNVLFWHTPEHSGRRFYVAPSASYTVEGQTYAASDSNDGLNVRKAKLTPHALFSSSLVSSGDVVVLLPGAHSWSSSLVASVAGVTITGLPRGAVHTKNRMPISGTQCLTSVTLSTADEVINVTAADVEICHLHVIPVATSQGIDYSAAATRLHVHDCTFNLSTAEDTATMGIEAVGAGTDVLLDHNYFLVVGNQGPAIRVAAATVRNKIENSTIELDGATAWDDAIEVTAAWLQGKIDGVDFITSGAIAITDCIELTGATGDGETYVMRCTVPAGSDAIEAAATLDLILVNNYIATVSGGTGGTLITG